MSSLAPTALPLRNITDLPGPKGWPLVGNSFQVSRSQLHQSVEAWAKQFGPLFQMKLGRKRMLVVTDPELIAAALKDRPEGFRRNPATSLVSTEMGLPQGLFSAEGEDWKRQRRMVMASFSPGQVRAYFPSLVKVNLRLRGRWQRAASAGTTIPLQADLMRYTVDGISGLAFGKDVNTLEAGEDVIQRHLDQLLPSIFRRALAVVPVWRWYKSAKDRRLDESVAVINQTIRDYVAQARAALAAEPAARAAPRNLLEAMIVAADTTEGGQHSGLTDAHITGNVLTMLLAGEDTTANTLAWMIWLLWQHPDALARLQDEVRTLAPRPEDFTIEQMDNLEYLDACCTETMRLKPVAPFIPLQALRDTRVGDVAVPKDEVVWCVLRHQSVAEPWFAQAQDFRPERWLPDAQPALTAEAKRAPLPFGAGPRMCPGRYLALLEMKMAMAMLLSSFDIQQVDTPDHLPPPERLAFTMMPVGLGLKLKERQG